MSERLSLEVVDENAVPTGSSEDDPGITRAKFLGRAAVAGGALAVGGVLISGLPGLAAASKPSPEMDVEILNHLLMLEQLQREFYVQALDQAELKGELRRFAETAGENERDHVDYLRRVLAGDARPAPAFEFGAAVRGAKKFRAAALVLEDLAVSAYVGQGPNLTTNRVLAAARISSVEARHAAWIRDIAGKLPAPAAADAASSEAQVNRVLRSRGWLT
jgi:Ferritin-like domain